MNRLVPKVPMRPGLALVSGAQFNHRNDMTRNQAKELLLIIQAYAEGKTIQVRGMVAALFFLTAICFALATRDAKEKP